MKQINRVSSKDTLEIDYWVKFQLLSCARRAFRWGCAFLGARVGVVLFAAVRA